MAQCLVSFGANLGARESVIAVAARELSVRSEVANFRASRLYETPPIGGPSGQDPFLNGVAAFDTTAGARQVLGWLQELENRLGRVRDRRWAARRIDLDVVLHGNLIGGASDLTVPHPRYTARRFVLRPACDVAADYRDPRFGWTIGDLADHLERGNASMALTGGDTATRADLCEQLAKRFSIQTFAENPYPAPMAIIGTAPAAGQQPTDRAGDAAIIDVQDDRAWVSAFVGPLDIDQAGSERNIPRLIARMQWTQPDQRWPAPHKIWPSTSRWPEYRLEVDDLQWAAGEIASALDSMRCPIEPITPDGDWWR
jgi:2-amino-4-hydroxy-6-hydroxymethyldihydropteridine diphosphokinase